MPIKQYEIYDITSIIFVFIKMHYTILVLDGITTEVLKYQYPCLWHSGHTIGGRTAIPVNTMFIVVLPSSGHPLSHTHAPSSWTSLRPTWPFASDCVPWEDENICVNKCVVFVKSLNYTTFQWKFPYKFFSLKRHMFNLIFSQCRF